MFSAAVEAFIKDQADRGEELSPAITALAEADQKELQRRCRFPLLLGPQDAAWSEAPSDDRDKQHGADIEEQRRQQLLDSQQALSDACTAAARDLCWSMAQGPSGDDSDSIALYVARPVMDGDQSPLCVPTGLSRPVFGAA